MYRPAAVIDTSSHAESQICSAQSHRERAGVLADLDPPRIGPPGPNPRGVQIRCDTGVHVARKHKGERRLCGYARVHSSPSFIKKQSKAEKPYNFADNFAM